MTVIGASLEVIKHHVQQHTLARPDCSDAGTRESWCPCDQALVLICEECQDPVFLICRPGEPCIHAQAVMQAGG